MSSPSARHTTAVEPWPVAASIDELVSGATSRRPIDPDDGKSGSTFELVEIDGGRFFLKVTCYADDWISRIIGDREHWPLKLWRAGLYGAVPSCIDPAVVGMALDESGGRSRLGTLMRDVSDTLVPEGDSTVDLGMQLRFLRHMAALHAELWGWTDTIGLLDNDHRFRFFAPDNIAAELETTDVPAPLAAADEGWRRLAERAPRLHDIAVQIHRDPGLVGDPLRTTPSTFLHGDWKMGNLGEHPDGRTVLLDWAYPGAGPACYDLAWYLALNAARLPHPKEDAIEAYRSALVDHGVEVEPWWERQLGLCLLGIMATFGWEKALGDEAELRWWEAQALGAMRWLS